MALRLLIDRLLAIAKRYPRWNGGCDWAYCRPSLQDRTGYTQGRDYDRCFGGVSSRTTRGGGLHGGGLGWTRPQQLNTPPTNPYSRRYHYCGWATTGTAREFQRQHGGSLHVSRFSCHLQLTSSGSVPTKSYEVWAEI